VPHDHAEEVAHRGEASTGEEGLRRSVSVQHARLQRSGIVDPAGSILVEIDEP
jgi:hypothetical protein